MKSSSSTPLLFQLQFINIHYQLRNYSFFYSILNKCRVLHRNIFDTGNHNVWRYNQYLLSDNMTQCNIDVEHKILSSIKKSSFYNYINTKLNNKNLIPPIRNRVDHNSIYTNDFDKADWLSEKCSFFFLKSHIYYDTLIMKGLTIFLYLRK